VENVDHAFASGDEDEAGFGSRRRRRRRRRSETSEHFTGVGIEDDELLRIAAGAEEAVMLDVDGEAVGVPAGARTSGI